MLFNHFRLSRTFKTSTHMFRFFLARIAACRLFLHTPWRSVICVSVCLCWSLPRVLPKRLNWSRCSLETDSRGRSEPLLDGGAQWRHLAYTTVRAVAMRTVVTIAVATCHFAASRTRLVNEEESQQQRRSLWTECWRHRRASIIYSIIDLI